MNIDYVYDFHKNHSLVQKKDTFIKKGLCGLTNLGNKCFLNSIIQCLSHTLKLTDYLLSNKHVEDDPEQLNKRKEEHFLLISYVQLLINLWDTNQVIKPKSFVENLSKFIKKYFTLQQQDSHECLLFILELLHKALSYEIDVDIQGDVQNERDALMKQSLESWKHFYEKKYSILIELFNGLLYNKINCTNCQSQENVFEPYNHISIDIPDSSSDLVPCLKSFFQHNETISSWQCSKCNNKGCEKNCKFWSVPNYIIIHLKRFNNNGQKKRTQIDFPIEDLNLTEYISSDKSDPNNYIYSLYAVNYHSGDTHGGHYWASCRNLDDNWYLFNDAHVSKIHNLKELVTKDAYILFYYRKFIKKPVLV
jgi:ubiquitin carboxyl-terminal hydrolase 8